MTSRLMLWVGVAVLGMAVLAATPVSAAPYSVYTPTTGKACKPFDNEHDDIWSCPGPGGVRAWFNDHGPWFRVGFSRGDGFLMQIGWPPAAKGRAIGERMEWRIAGRRPMAAILHIRETRCADVPCDDKPAEFLLVMHVPGNCEIGRIDARLRDANERARRLADASDGNCVARGGVITNLPVEGSKASK